jgi:hypothetical protein
MQRTASEDGPERGRERARERERERERESKRPVVVEREAVAVADGIALAGTGAVGAERVGGDGTRRHQIAHHLHRLQVVVGRDGGAGQQLLQRPDGRVHAPPLQRRLVDLVRPEARPQHPRPVARYKLLVHRLFFRHRHVVVVAVAATIRYAGLCCAVLCFAAAVYCARKVRVATSCNNQRVQSSTMPVAVPRQCSVAGR